MKKIYLIVIVCVFIILSQGCKEKDDLQKDPIKIDFTKTESDAFINDSEEVTPKEFKVAISAIISPREGLKFYKDLIIYLENKTGIPFQIIQRKTYQEVNLMLRNNSVNLAFICSGAYVAEKKISEIEIIAVPQTNGKPFYQAYIIANKSSTVEKFEDFKGKSFAFTDPLSNTGKLYAIKRLNDIGYNEKDFFSKTIYSNAHDTSIQLVSKNIVDGASVDGLIFEYLKKHNSERVNDLKIIEKSDYFGIPPIVVPSNLDSKLKSIIKSSLLSMHKDSIGKEILNQLLIDKFIEGNDSNYDGIREMQNDLIHE